MFKEYNYKDIVIEGKQIPEEFKEVSDKIIKTYLNMLGLDKTTMEVKFQANYNNPNTIECVVNRIPGSRYSAHVNQVDIIYKVSEEFRKAMGVPVNTNYYYKADINKIKNRISYINVYNSILNVFVKDVIKTTDFGIILHNMIQDSLGEEDKNLETKLLITFNKENGSDTVNTLIQRNRGVYMDIIGESYDPVIFANLYMYYVTTMDTFIRDQERELLFKIFIEKLIPLTLELKIKELKEETK